MTTRRGFLGAMLAAAAAPAFVRAEVLMPVRKIIVPSALVLWGDGVHDDTAALQSAINGGRVQMADGTLFSGVLVGGSYLVSQTLHLGRDTNFTASGVRFDGRGIKGGGPVVYAEYGTGGTICNSYIESPMVGPAINWQAPV